MSAHINIFDVEHGACASIHTPTGHTILLDCGHNSSTNWRPSTWLTTNRLQPELLIVSNLDEDHVSDLANVDRLCAPNRFYTNLTVPPEYVVREKSTGTGMTPGMTTAVSYMRSASANPAPPLNFGIEYYFFENPYPAFSDFNNLSVVTFAFYAGHGIIFPGDIEQRAWRMLLARPDFRQCLSRVNLFVASHHGRQNGFEPTVFDHCRPEIILISDKSVSHGSQLTSGRYGAYARGVMFGRTRRDVLTTRNDGAISISIRQDGQANIQTAL